MIPFLDFDDTPHPTGPLAQGAARGLQLPMQALGLSNLTPSPSTS